MNTPLHECEKFLRTVDLVGNSKQRGILGVSKSTLWRWIQQNHFPAPLKLGPNISVWRMSEVQAWMDAQKMPVYVEDQVNKWFNRKNASIFLSQHLKSKTAEQWNDWLTRNIRQSKHVYKLAFKEFGRQICYSETTLLAFIKASTTPFNQMNKGVQNGH